MAKPVPIHLSHLQIRNPKDDETTPEAATQIFTSLFPSHVSLWSRLYRKVYTYAFEIYLINQTIYYYVTVPQETQAFVKSLITSSYPLSKIQKTTDPMEIVYKYPNVSVGEMVLGSYYYLPIKTYADFNNLDPLTSLIGFLSKQDASLRIGIQILATPAHFHWQRQALSAISKKKEEPQTADMPLTTQAPDPNKSMITKKTAFQGGKAAVRMVVSSSNTQLDLYAVLQNLAGTYGGLSAGEGNRFDLRQPGMGREKFELRLKRREFTFFERRKQILNAQELATLWHPASTSVSQIKNISWGKTLKGEPPENLPIIRPDMSEEEKNNINFFASTDYKNKETIFGIKSIDRSKHIYVMGKTGAGKSTLIANMAIDDIRKDRGIAIVDPHGDLCETIVNYIPKRRINDVIYLEPFDTDRPFSLNILATNNPEQKHLIASGIVSIFSKLYANSWGPRLEYILRNVIITLVEIPGSTLADVIPMLAQDKYRARVIQNITDPVIKSFWEKEFNEMQPRQRIEAVSPIQNKVGQFVTSKMIRNIIGHSKSTLNLEEIMDTKKILLLNLSQGKLGEDNAALLGAMIITQIQLTAMARAYKKEEDRVPFFLYVDEFQNFATSSFLKILSEARKYKLSLTLANQYIDQLDEDIQRAIFGNIGTLITFVVGARDAGLLTKEFSNLYTENDLVALGKFEIITKLSIDNMTTFPFPAKTLPLPSVRNNNFDKILRLSKEKYGRKVKDDPEPTYETDDGDQPQPQSQARPQRQKEHMYGNRKHNNGKPQFQKKPHLEKQQPQDSADRKTGKEQTSQQERQNPMEKKE